MNELTSDVPAYSNVESKVMVLEVKFLKSRYSKNSKNFKYFNAEEN